jgi:hypothetical protein
VTRYREEEKPGRESWFYLLEQPEGFDFAARFEWPGATNRAWTWRCRRGPHTEGEMALVARVGPPNPQGLKPTYRQTAFLSHYYPNLRNNFEASSPDDFFSMAGQGRPGVEGLVGV